MIGLLGKKIGMTQVFSEEGRQVSVTVLQIGPCHVTELRTPEKNGYTAVQLGFDEKKEKSFSKPERGQFKKSKTPFLNFVKEIRTKDIEGLEVGTELKVDNFEEGDFVDIEGISIGKGFQGVVKRHNFSGGDTGHGNNTGRKPGSTGMSAYPARTIKGQKLPGQTGNEKVTVQNLKVVKVDLENDLIAVKGAVPGHEGGYLIVTSAIKRGETRKWKVPQVEEEKKPEQEEAPKEEAKEEAPAAETKAPAEKVEEKAEKKEPQEAPKEAAPAQESKPEAEAKDANPAESKEDKKS